MRVRLLGTGSADGWPNPFCTCRSCAAERADGRARMPSSALVDDTVLIDCGPTTPHLPATSGVRLDAVEHVLLTHGHPDHLHPAFLLTRSWTGAVGALHVWGPARAIDLCRDWIGPQDPVHLHVVAGGDRVRLDTARGTYAVTALPAAHAHGDGDVMALEALLYCVAGPDDRRLLYATDTGPLPDATIALVDGRVDIAVIDETFGDHLTHGTGHLDLATLPREVERLRAAGVVTDGTVVAATHLSHHNPPTRELVPRLAEIGVRVASDGDVLDTEPTRHRTLVLGGARSGKSRHAEGLLATRPHVTYVATGGARDGDAEWQHRVQEHRRRRPAHWATLETTDVADVIAKAAPGQALLVDCLALWLTAVLDACDAWHRCDDGDVAAVTAAAMEHVDLLVDALDATRAEVVLVSNEVGQGLVPTGAGSRLYRDLLGVVNVRVGQACDRTVLVVAGHPMTLGGHA